VSAKSKTLVNRARHEMDVRLDRVNKAVVSFFETEISGSFLGLPQLAREHLDKFRSFLNSFYTQQYGCWPPDDFEDEAVQQDVYSTLFSDFQNLYQHLVDFDSSADMVENDISKSGGVCILQNIQAFDRNHAYEPLVNPMPRLPTPFERNATQQPKLQRRLSWNPKLKRKALREARKTHDKQSLIGASNRDVLLMDCPLVREYSDYEETVVNDDLTGLSAIEGRKVRWILVYAALQTFHSIAQPPKEVRNTANLSYSLCCRPPTQKPWQELRLPEIHTRDQGLSELAPDNGYSHTNASSASLGETITRGRSNKARRRTLPANLPASLLSSLSGKSPPGSRSASLRRLVSRHGRAAADEPLPKRPSFCEIYVEGYGNGLNKVADGVAETTVAELTAEPEPVDCTIKEEVAEAHELPGDVIHEMAANNLEVLPPLPPSDGSTRTPTTMSRESSSASISETCSSSLEDGDEDPKALNSDRVLTLVEILKSTCISNPPHATGEKGQQRPHSFVAQGPNPDIGTMDLEKFDQEFHAPYVHFNTLTWDSMLEQRPMTAPAATAVAA
jgi:hypothetical protein